MSSGGHLGSLLWRNDRMGMLAGIESRFPFLDTDLASFLLSSPRRHRHRGGETKAPLRAAARAFGVSAELADRPKFAFSANPSFFCPVSAGFFRGGFLESYLPEITSARQGEDWDNFYFYLVAVEVWGRLFPLGQSVEDVTGVLEEHRRS